ncbi:MAG: xanthosine permease [Planctomycetota bacterium]
METASGIPWLRTRLSVQMFLQFAVWGAWAPVLYKHLLNLGFAPEQAGPIMGTGPLAIMITPLIAGQIADRWFAAERYMGVSFLGAGTLLLIASRIDTPDFSSMWGLLLATMLLFGPTLGLGNAICFHHLKDPAADFPLIRVWGTVGWIASAFIVNGVMHAFDMNLSACLVVAGSAAILNGLYSFTLPHTPPKRDAAEKMALAKTLGMLKNGSFALFSLLAFVLLIFATFYYFKNAQFFPTLGIADEWLGPTQSIGQAAEIVTMFLLPFVYKKLGPKKTIAIGLFAWALRFAVFALGTPAWLVIASQALHGVCFACGIAAAMIYFESISPPDVRGSVQSFLTWITYGFGMFVGAYVMEMVGARYTTPAAEQGAPAVLDWHAFWTVPAAGCFAILFVFLIGFKAQPAAERPAS